MINPSVNDADVSDKTNEPLEAVNLRAYVSDTAVPDIANDADAAGIFRCATVVALVPLNTKVPLSARIA